MCARLPSGDDRRYCSHPSTQDQYDGTSMTPTAEQIAILARPPTGIIKVAAGAGCGKTWTLVEYGRRWPARGLYLAFNRSIADEAGRKFPATIQTRTAHSFAYRTLNIGKRGSPIASYRFEHLQPYEEFIKPIAGMSYGQVRAAILRTLDSFMIDAGSKLHADYCSLADIGQRTPIRQMVKQIAARMLKIDRHDLPITHDTYLKAFELWHRIEGSFEYLLLDLAQDLNPVLISIAQKAGLPTVVVGDTYQSIYRFRGAVDAMNQFDADELPLTLSWRFGAEVATLCNRILRHHSQPPKRALRGNPDRATEIIRYGGPATAGDGTAILARTNARLFEALATMTKPFHLLGGFGDLQRQLSSAYALRTNDLHLVADPSVARFTSWRQFDDAAERATSMPAGFATSS
jgi:F-box protein 18 (helicase)